MTMALKRLNYTLNRGIIGILLLMIASSLECKATDNESNEVALDSIVTDIDYTYELYNRSNGKLDCVGILSVSVEIPSDAKTISFMRTLRTSHDPHFFMERTGYEVKDQPTIDISRTKIYWNTFFKVGVFYNDGHYESTSTYSINDFIKPEDLCLLEVQTGIEDPHNDPVCLIVQDRNLYVDTSESINLSVFNILGRELFCGQISEPTTIPVETAGSSVVVVNYVNSNISKTKKLIVR